MCIYWFSINSLSFSLASVSAKERASYFFSLICKTCILIWVLNVGVVFVLEQTHKHHIQFHNVLNLREHYMPPYHSIRKN